MDKSLLKLVYLFNFTSIIHKIEERINIYILYEKFS